MEIKLGKLLGTGGACEVYEFENGLENGLENSLENGFENALENGLERNKVIKLYFEGYDKDFVEWEYSKTFDANSKGLPTPKVYEIVEHDNRFGLVMEKVTGQTLMDIMLNFIIENSGKISDDEIFMSPEVYGNIKISAKILYDLHCIKADLMDTVEERLKRILDWNNSLTDQEKKKISNVINELPKDNSACHGDPNSGNIIKNGESYRLLDWVSVVSGSAYYDLAQYVVMFRYVNFPENTPSEIISFIDNYKEKIIHAFLYEYSELSKISLDDIIVDLEKWLIPVCVERINATTLNEEMKEFILQEIRRKL